MNKQECCKGQIDERERKKNRMTEEDIEFVKRERVIEREGDRERGIGWEREREGEWERG